MRNLLLAVSLLWSSQAPGQAAPKAPPGMHLEVGNKDVRVWRLKKLPHKPSPSHYAPPAVLVFLEHTRMRWTFPDKPAVEEEFQPGAVKWWTGGIHVSENVGDSPVELLVIVPLSALPQDPPKP